MSQDSNLQQAVTAELGWETAWAAPGATSVVNDLTVE
jgi:hypothetical protein